MRVFGLLSFAPLVAPDMGSRPPTKKPRNISDAVLLARIETTLPALSTYLFVYIFLYIFMRVCICASNVLPTPKGDYPTLKRETGRLGSPTAQAPPYASFGVYIMPRRATARAGKPTPPLWQ